MRGQNGRIDHVARLCGAAAFAGLATLIARTGCCRCSDPRDRIYAVLGMVGNLKRILILSQTTWKLLVRSIKMLR
jgi:hypothetical protein